MTRGEIWWADLGIPSGSEPGFRRPVLVIQDDAFNSSRIRTTVVLSITSNLDLAAAPGNVLLEKHESGLPIDSVINVSQIASLDKKRLNEMAGLLRKTTIEEVNASLELLLGLG
jgi:mRNA interferase MazF